MRGPLLLTRPLAVLMATQSLIGLLLWEHYRDPEPIRTTWFGNDWVMLILAVPLLLFWGTLLVVTTVIALVLLASVERERVVSP